MKLALYRTYIKDKPYQNSMPPLGLGYLSSFVKKHCWYCETAFFRDVAQMIEWRPDIVGISSATENFNDAVNTARRLKDELDIPVWIGGSHITILPHTLPECFDVGIIGEGEETAVELVKLYYDHKPAREDYSRIRGIAFHDGNKVFVGEKRELISDMDQLPFPDRECLGREWALPFEEESHLITSRGCPYDCVFCSAPRQWKGVRYFSPEYVCREVEFLREKYDPREIFFFDDLFIGNVPRFRETCRIFAERKLHEGVIFRTYGRSNIINGEIADLFAEYNFRYIDFGFESNSQPVLDYLNKKGVTPESNQRSIDLLYERGISIGGNFIIGSPYETLEQMQETRSFVERNREKLDRVSMGPLQPIPGTRIWDYAKERGIVSEDMDWSRFIIDCDNLDLDENFYLCEKAPRDEFMKFYEGFHQLVKEINLRGEIRKLNFDLQQSRSREQELESRIDTLTGSRLVRFAMKLKRDFENSSHER